MAGSDFFKLDVQIHDAARGCHGQRVVQFAPLHGDSLSTSALKLLTSCFLDGERVCFRTHRSGAGPDVAHLCTAGRIRHWVNVDPVDARPLRFGSGRAERVSAVFSSVARAQAWWSKYARKCGPIQSLSVYAVPDTALHQLLGALEHRMRWHCTLDGNAVVLCSNNDFIEINLVDVSSGACMSDGQPAAAI